LFIALSSGDKKLLSWLMSQFPSQAAELAIALLEKLFAQPLLLDKTHEAALAEYLNKLKKKVIEQIVSRFSATDPQVPTAYQNVFKPYRPLTPSKSTQTSQTNSIPPLPDTPHPSVRASKLEDTDLKLSLVMLEHRLKERRHSEPLMLAAFEGDIETAVTLLSQDPSLVSRESPGLQFNPLSLAIFAKQEEMVFFLLGTDEGKKVALMRSGGRNVLHWAATNDNANNMLGLMMLNQPEISALATQRSEQNMTPLMMACAEGKVDIVRVLLSLPNAEELTLQKDKDWNSACIAAANGHWAVLALLLAMPNASQQIAQDPDTGIHPYYLAVMNKHAAAEKILHPYYSALVGKEAYTRVNLQTTSSKPQTSAPPFQSTQKPIHNLRTPENLDPPLEDLPPGLENRELQKNLRRLLLVARLEKHNNPLLLAAVTGDVATTAQLLSAPNADDLIRGVSPSTKFDALTFALIAEQTQIVLLLLETDAGKQEALKTRKDRNALHWAASHDSDTCLLALVKNVPHIGGLASKPAEQGLTPLMMASAKGKATMVQALLTLPNAEELALQTHKGWNSACIAAVNGYVDVLEHLLQLPNAAQQLATDTDSNASPLTLAISTKQYAVVDFITRFNLNEFKLVREALPGLHNPVIATIALGKSEFLTKLLPIDGRKADLLTLPYKGRNPLMLAMSLDDNASAKLLLEHAQPSEQAAQLTAGGANALVIAISRNNVEGVKLLLALPNAKQQVHCLVHIGEVRLHMLDAKAVRETGNPGNTLRDLPDFSIAQHVGAQVDANTIAQAMTQVDANWTSDPARFKQRAYAILDLLKPYL
jgi:ankyrin repeat protein